MKDVNAEALEHLGLSVLYRASICLRDRLHQNDLGALECWRQKILSRKSAAACHPMICIPTNDVPSHPIATVLNKTFKMAIVEESGFRLTWVNMPGFIMAGFLGFPRDSQADEFNNVFNRVAKSQAQQLSVEANELTLKRK